VQASQLVHHSSVFHMNAKELTFSSSFSYLQRATEGKARSLVPEGQISQRFWDANPHRHSPTVLSSIPRTMTNKVLTSQIFSYMFLSFMTKRNATYFQDKPFLSIVLWPTVK
jgi:hypothetical protein